MILWGIKKMIHREVVVKKKVPIIVMGLFVLTALLYIGEIIKRSSINQYISVTQVNLISGGIILFLIIKQVYDYSLSYKHAIIADKFIINKITSREEKNIISIKVSDILYIGKKSHMPKEYLKIRKIKSYLCNKLEKDNYYCVYKKGEFIEKIKFQPSERFINRIIKHGALKCKL